MIRLYDDPRLIRNQLGAIIEETASLNIAGEWDCMGSWASLGNVGDELRRRIIIQPLSDLEFGEALMTGFTIGANGQLRWFQSL